MRKRISIVSFFGIIVLVVLLVLPKEYLSIQNDGVYFNMTDKALEKIKGKSIEIEHNIGDTPFERYIYAEQMYGYQARCSYSFYKSLFGLRLRRVFVEISDISFDDANTVIDKINGTLINYYSNKRGYYNYGLQVEDNALYLVLGTSSGAVGNSYHIKYENGNLTISAIKQE